MEAYRAFVNKKENKVLEAYTQYLYSIKVINKPTKYAITKYLLLKAIDECKILMKRVKKGV